jgi:hypothetical protein
MILPLFVLCCKKKLKRDWFKYQEQKDVKIALSFRKTVMQGSSQYFA